MPIVIKGLEPQQDKRLDILKITFIMLNLAAALLNGIFLFIADYLRVNGKNYSIFQRSITVLIFIG